MNEFEEYQRHEYFEIMVNQNGKGMHQIDLINYEYEGSVMFMLSPGQLHHITPTIPSEGFSIKFLPSLFNHEKDFSIL